MRGLAGLFREERNVNEASFPSWTPRSGTGPWVTETSALQLSAVWACETLIADAIATLPVQTYRKVDDRRVGTTTPGWVERPNVETDRVDYDTQRLLALLGWGNCYSLLVRQGGTADRQDPVLERWFVDPSRVEVRRNGPNLAYYVDGRQVPTGNVQHVRGYIIPGENTAVPLGMSVVAKARQSMGLGASTEAFGAKFFENGIAPSGALEVPAMPADASGAVIDRLREQFAERNAGTGNAHKPVVLTGGTKWSQITVNPVDAQFLEQRKFQVEEICRWFRVPPHKIQAIGGNASQGGGNGLETMAMEFSQDCLLPWTIRLERADSDLLPRGEYVRYNLDAYVRVDLQSRYAAFTSGRNGGWYSVNDIRRYEDLPPIDNGDVYLQAANYIEAGGDSGTDAQGDDPVGATQQGRSLSVAEVVQKVYLGVGVVITVEEARRIITAAGADFDPEDPAALAELLATPDASPTDMPPGTTSDPSEGDH